MALPRHALHRAAHRAGWWTAAPALRSAVRMPLVRPSALLVAACALVAGSVTQATANQIHAENVHRAEALAADADQTAQQVMAAYRARVDAAATTRLSAQATAYLAGQRTEARKLAQGAIETAGQLTAAGTDVLGADDLAELDQAVADLTFLLAATPDAQAALDDAVARAGATTAEPAVKDVVALPELDVAVPTVDALPVTPLADALELVGAAPTRGTDRTAPEGAPSAAAAESDGPTTAPTPVLSPSRVGGAPRPAPATDPVADDAVLDLARTPDPGTVDVPAPDTVPGEAVPAATVLATADLDLVATERLTEVAHRVLELSAQVQATLDAALAALQEQQAMQAKAAADAARVSSLVKAANAAPNGAIPEQYLCHVDFAASVLLRCDAALALEALDRAYRHETGHHLVVVSSYRTVSTQEVLFDEKGEIAAAPGTSNHGRGLAIDLAGAGNLGQYDAPVYLWLKAHAQDYGWHHPAVMEPEGPGPYEPWHWEYGTQD